MCSFKGINTRFKLLVLGWEFGDIFSRDVTETLPMNAAQRQQFELKFSRHGQGHQRESGCQYSICTSSLVLSCSNPS